VSLARGAAIGALGALAVVLALVLFGGGGGHQYRLIFQTAGQLVKGDEVQVGGHGAGSIDAITLTKNNQAAIDVTVEDQYAPLHAGTSATVRLTSLSGVANRYIQLDLGPNNAPKLPDNATINLDHTTSVVDLDQIFDTLDAPTRQGLSRFIQGNAAWYKGKSGLANLSSYYFNPALSTTTDVFNQISGDQATLSQAVTATAGAVGAIAARHSDLTDAITYGNQFGSAIAAENTSFSQALADLPKTLRRANSTFVDLRGALTNVQDLINVSLPNTTGLPALLTALRPAVANAVPVFSKFSGIIYKPGANNDTTDTFRNAPIMQNLANGDDHKSFPESILAAQRGTQVFQFARPYTVDLVGWLREFGGLTSFYDANGHYARVDPVFNAYKYNSGTNGLDVLNADQRTSIYSSLPSGTGNYSRCPGAASQVPASMGGDWPFLSGGATGCDQSQKVPGP
jgi:phospholipid/cholesterol/gamma-HCH transport system substrate-binding protein